MLDITDNNIDTCARNVPCIHTYQHLFCCNPRFSGDMSMRAKVHYYRMKNADWRVVSLLERLRGLHRDEQEHERDEPNERGDRH